MTKPDVKACDAAQLLHGVADSIKIIRLPDLAEHGDVSDWLDAGHTVDELSSFCNAAPDWQPGDADSDAPISVPAIIPGTGISVATLGAALASAKPAKSEDSEPAITLSFFSDLVEAKPKP